MREFQLTPRWIGTARQGFGLTSRKDAWWIAPTATGLAFGAFVLYSMFSAFLWHPLFGAPIEAEGYLSPFFSPLIGPDVLPPALSALLILWIPLGFRATCYYYRKAEYRSFFLAPAACAVPEPHKRYGGERRFPLVLMNSHRYFFYGALLFGAINVYDGVLAFQGRDGGFGLGLGTLIIWVNLVMLWAYTLSCHACRHIVGGKLKHFSRHPLRYAYWVFVSKLNARHGQYAMISLFTVIITDAYIMAVSAGWFSDLRFVN